MPTIGPGISIGAGVSVTDTPNIQYTNLVFYLDAGFSGSYPGTGTTWYDLRGNNNTTLVNGPTYSSNNGGYIDFDGVNDRADCGTNFSTYITGTNSFSISCWVYPENTQNTYSDIWGNHTDNVTGVVCQQNANNLNQYSWGWGNGVSWVTSGTSGYFNLTTQAWSYMTAVRDGSSILTYVNGALVDTKTNSTSVVPNTTFNFQIGTGYNLDSTRYFNGNVATFGIYSRAITAAEVLQNYLALRSRYGY